MNIFHSDTIFGLVRNSLYVLVLVSVHSCQHEAMAPTVYSIEEDFTSYMETFIAEAETRGIEIKKENLIVAFGATSTEVCGECINPTGVGQRRITINNCWQNALSENREALIFHEFGHCLLNRAHKNELLPNGAAASIMNSDNDAPYSPCVYVIDGDLSCNKTARRSYYIDELFDPHTDVPEWGE